MQTYTLTAAVDLYLRLHFTGKSPSYRTWSATRLKSLIAHLGPDQPLDTISVTDLNLWINALVERNTLYQDHPKHDPQQASLSPATVKGYVRAVKTFFNGANRFGWLTQNPAAHVKPPPVPISPPKAATPEELDALQAVVSEYSLRNYAALQFLRTTGVRVSELVGLTHDRLFLDERYALVYGKGRGGGGKARVVPYSHTTATVLHEYCCTKDSLTGHLFLSRTGKPWSTAGVRQMMKLASDKAGLHRTITPHMIRHAFGVQSIKSGMNMRTLQMILGHAAITTTEIYTRFNAGELVALYDASHS